MNCTVIGADPKLLFIAKKEMGDFPDTGGTVGRGVLVGDGVYVGNTAFIDRIHTNDEDESLPPLLYTISFGRYLAAAV